MKRIYVLLLSLLLSSTMMAKDLVRISYSGRAELEKVFADPNLTVHYYTDNAVFATAERFDANTMVLIDHNAFEGNEVYTLVYCPKADQPSYIQGKESLLQADEYVIVKGAALPFKNDGAVTIFNKEAQLPRLTRDFPQVTEENPAVREMLDQVDATRLEAIVQHMQDYESRLWASDNAYAASNWIAEQMRSLGLEVEQMPFDLNIGIGGDPAPNVIGIQRGTLYPDTYVVCGSHFDSFSYDAFFGYGTAPGADDNATGVSSVLESARILTQYEFEYSIIYCTFGCEELGLYGSEAYAARCQQQGMDIIGYFNNDMNGYLYGDIIHIDCIYPDAVEPIGEFYRTIGSVYYPEVPIRHVQFNQGDSDHTSFNNHGYMGIFPFEDYEHDSPYIHSPEDLIGPSVNSFEMSKRFCQMNLACLAECARLVGSTPQVSCNPVVNFYTEHPVDKDMTTLALLWDAPEEGSTGELQHFDVYRDNAVIGSVEYDPGFIHYNYIDTITVGAQAEYFIMAVYSDGCEAPSETLIGEGIPSGISEMDAVKAAVYPNPVQSQLNIVAKGMQRIAVYNAMGQLVETKTANGNHLVLQVDGYSKGVYLLQIVTNDGMTTKFVAVK